MEIAEEEGASLQVGRQGSVLPVGRTEEAKKGEEVMIMASKEELLNALEEIYQRSGEALGYLEPEEESEDEE
jgi:hypothetical protein